MTENIPNVMSIISKIYDRLMGEEYIYRGVPEIFYNYDDINSSIYREHKENLEFTNKFLPVHVEAEIVEKAKRLFRPDTSNIEILTDIRHFGGYTTLIDFTRNLMVALFFACNGKFEKDGQIIAIPATAFPSFADINYKNKIWKDSIIEPTPTQSQPRTIAQSSIFVHAPQGYIEKRKCNILRIEQYWKKPILDYLHKVHNISHNTIYNDLVGFISNEENFQTAALPFYRGLRFQNNKQDKEAIIEYDKAIYMNPNYTKAYNNRGISKRNLGQNNEAIADYNEAIRQDSSLAEVYNNRGNVKRILKQYQEAIIDYNEAIKLDSSLAEAYFNRGNSKATLGKHEEAIADYNETILLKPSNVDAYYSRGISKAMLGQYKESITDYDEAIRLNHPNNAEVYLMRGIAKTTLGLYKEAITDFDKSINLNLKCEEVYINRGNSNYQLGKKEEALSDYGEAIRQNPLSAEAYYNRGILKDEMGQYKEAIIDYDQAISLDPKHAKAYYNRGISKAALNLKDEAKADFEKTLSLDPNLANPPI